MRNKRDSDILAHIVEYCEEINLAIAMFDDTLETLKANRVYKNAVSMCVLQIGELTTHFTTEFLAANTKNSLDGHEKNANHCRAPLRKVQFKRITPYNNVQHSET